MPKILCTLPNASNEISGVKFVSHADGMISEDVSDEVAESFLAITGYALASAPAPASQSQDDSGKAEKDELVKKAEALGVTVKGNWGVDRLKAEIEKAEKAASEKAAAEAAAEGADGQ